MVGLMENGYLNKTMTNEMLWLQLRMSKEEKVWEELVPAGNCCGFAICCVSFKRAWPNQK